jgi:hypothetical protein
MKYMRFGVVLSIENYPIACSFVRLSLALGVGPSYPIVRAAYYNRQARTA